MIASIARCAVSMRPSARWRSAVRSLTTATRAPPAWPRDSGMRVWYAPTWEGDRPSIAYGSLASHGVAIIEALLADPSIRVIYRPHARTGYASREHRDADKAVGRCSQRPATGTLLIATVTAGSGTSPMPASPISQRSPMTGCRRASRW